LMGKIAAKLNGSELKTLKQLLEAG
jgi:hypothetical protein